MFKIYNHYVSKGTVLLLSIEILLLVMAFYAGTALRLANGAALLDGEGATFLAPALVFALAIVFSMSAFGMYQLNFTLTLRHRLFVQLLPAFAMGFGLLTLLYYMLPGLHVGRGILLLVLGISLGAISGVRAVFVSGSPYRLLATRLIFLGHGALARDCAALASHPGSCHKYRIAGYIARTTEPCCVPLASVLEVEYGTSLAALARRYKAREIVVTLQDRRGGALPIRELLECKLSGVAVTDAATFFERETCQIRVDSLQPSWLVFGGGFDQSPIRSVMKRLFDLLVSSAVLILALPLMLLTALCVYCEDGAPVFYQQERVGKNGRTFFILKFRSMGHDAERAGKPQWAQVRDPRVTRVGRWIRKLRIDELPQLLNVFKGEMSFVGPRPERPYFVDQLNVQLRYYQVRHSIKPGITGWAQVRYGYGATVEDAIQKLQYDLYYVKNNSLFLDLLVLIDTLKVVLFGGGR
jgi:sugar transferase (PEP-CTERM system associated)